MILSGNTSISVRKLGVAEFEANRDHLLRLDDESRAARFSGPVDDEFIKSYCLRLFSGPTIIVAALNRYQVRGACEIEYNSETGTAQLALSVESNWQGVGIGMDLLKESLITCFGIGAEFVTMVVPESNDRMRKLADRFGFEALDQSSDERAAELFVKKLDSLAPVIAVA